MALEPTGPQTTDLAYHASVEIKGRLAILGEMVLRATAGLLVEESTKRLRQRLMEGVPADGALTPLPDPPPQGGRGT
jgi:carbon monoxide dehydrogenase subunit G